MVDTVKENLNINKLISSKKELIFVEGDMIVPDSKPDILNTICTSGVVCVYKKEISNEKIRIDGNINTYIMYLTENSNDKIRGINTSLDFSESINIPNCEEGMKSSLNTRLKTIECKVINGRKIGIKATVEVDIRVYSNEEIEIINDVENISELQVLKEDMRVNSLVGTGETKIYAKDTITIDSIDNLAEILKTNICICDKDIKISYNKILTKAEAEVKLTYLTEDNRINTVKGKVPIVGFIDIPNVTEENICDINYEMRNIVIKPNNVEEHSIYVEMEIDVTAIVYEEKQINLIQDLYSPSVNLQFNKKQITTITNKRNIQETKQIRERVNVDGLENKKLVDVDVVANITKEEKINSRVMYEGVLELKFLTEDNDLEIDIKEEKIPFQHIIDNIEDVENTNISPNIEMINQDYIVQNGGEVVSNIDLSVNTDLYRDTRLSVIDEIQENEEREEQDYSLIMYIVKKGDTLWEIAKRFGSTIEDIVRINGIEDENKIQIGQKLFIPKYVKRGISSQKTPMINYA